MAPGPAPLRLSIVFCGAPSSRTPKVDQTEKAKPALLLCHAPPSNTSTWCQNTASTTTLLLRQALILHCLPSLPPILFLAHHHRATTQPETYPLKKQAKQALLLPSRTHKTHLDTHTTPKATTTTIKMADIPYEDQFKHIEGGEYEFRKSYLLIYMHLLASPI